MEYNRLPTACDLSETSLKMAAAELKPSRIFKLHVGAGWAYWAAKDLLVRQLERPDNPLYPYISLITELELKQDEWYLEDEEGNKVGSGGA